MQDSRLTPPNPPPSGAGNRPDHPGGVSLQAILELAGIGTWEYLVESGSFLFNDQYYRLHGLTAAEAGGYTMTASEFAARWVHAEDADAVVARIGEAAAAEDPSFQSRTEARILRADGQPLWVRIWLRVEKDARGRTVRVLGATQDIHERRLAEARAAAAQAELARSLRFTESLLDAVPTPVFYKDAAGRYLGCNAAFTEVMGVTAEQIRGKTVQECWPSEHAEVYHQRDLELLRDPRLQVYDFEVRDRHGERRSVIYAKNVFRDEADRIAGIVGAFMDITERARAEAALRRRQAFERLVTGISTQLAGRPDDEVDAGIHEALAAIGSFVGVDRAYVFLFRDPPTVMDNTHEWCAAGVGSEISRLQALPVERFPAVQALLKGQVTLVPRVADLPEGSAERAEFEREGIQSLVLVAVQSAGRLLGFLGLDAVRQERSFTEDDLALLRVVGETVGNVIERRRAQAALADRERRLRFVTDSMHDIVVQARADGTLEYVSPSLRRVLGYDPAELLGKSALHLLHPDDLEPVRAAVRRAVRLHAASCRLEYRFRHADGRYLWCESTVTLLRGARGEFAGAVLATRDISERKAVEEQLREARRLESIGRLAAGVAHDLNNMLTPIFGYAELLQLDPAASPGQQSQAAEILRAAERSRDLVRRLLAFSRKQVLDLRTVDMREVLAGMRAILRRTLRENIRLEILPGDETCPVSADVGQIEQVLLNLAMNAQDAMPDGGRLLMESGLADLDDEYCATHPEVAPGRYVMLSVSDTGLGMDEHTRTRAFEPFFTTKRAGQGTGLGLASVHGTVTQHGGFVRLYSEPGHGTTVKVFLPRVEAPAASSPRLPAPAPQVSRRTETVMVVEDDDAVRELLVRALEHVGCTVLSASTGTACLETLARHAGPLHLLLTDVIIPDLNGRELHERVARLHPAVKVLYISGYTHNVIARHGVLEEGVAFLPKPFSMQALLARLSEVLDGPAG